MIPPYRQTSTRTSIPGPSSRHGRERQHASSRLSAPRPDSPTPSRPHDEGDQSLVRGDGLPPNNQQTPRWAEALEVITTQLGSSDALRRQVQELETRVQMLSNKNDGLRAQLQEHERVALVGEQHSVYLNYKQRTQVGEMFEIAENRTRQWVTERIAEERSRIEPVYKHYKELADADAHRIDLANRFSGEMDAMRKAWESSVAGLQTQIRDAVEASLRQHTALQALRDQIATLEGQATGARATIEAQAGQIRCLEEQVGTAPQGLEGRLQAQEGQLRLVEQEAQEAQRAAAGTLTSALEERDNRFALLEERLTQLGERANALDDRTKGLDGQIVQPGTRIDSVVMDVAAAHDAVDPPQTARDRMITLTTLSENATATNERLQRVESAVETAHQSNAAALSRLEDIETRSNKRFQRVESAVETVQTSNAQSFRRLHDLETQSDEGFRQVEDAVETAHLSNAMTLSRLGYLEAALGPARHSTHRANQSHRRAHCVRKGKHGRLKEFGILIPGKHDASHKIKLFRR